MITLLFLDLELSICRFDPEESLPPWAESSRFLSVTKTLDVLSMVCETACLPDSPNMPVDSGWICFQVEGPLEFSMTGILASIATPLGEAGIPIFAISSYDTDYILIKEGDREAARGVLSERFILS